VKFFAVLISALIIAGCAGQPVSQLRQGVQSAVLIQPSESPLSFSTGVIDASSFWAEYGGSVSSQTGGWLWSSMASAGQKEGKEKKLTNAQLVEALYADHTMVASVNKALTSELSKLWTPNSSLKTPQVVSRKNVSIDPNTSVLNGIDTDADLVLMLDVRNINLTERFSTAGAFAAGFTMGTNKKSLTIEVSVLMQAFKPDVNGDYKSIWWIPCGANYATMDTSYYMDELMASKSKMTEILDEATQQSIDACTRLLKKTETVGM